MNSKMDVQEFTTAVVAALQYMACHPVAEVSIKSSNSTLHIRQTMDRYDGSGPNGSLDSSPRIQYGKSGNFKSKPSRKVSMNKPIPGLVIPDFSDQHKAESVDDQGNRVCFYCRKKGHTVRACFKLAAEQNIEIPRLQRKQSSSSSEN